jgi:hypothetical protein
VLPRGWALVAMYEVLGTVFCSLVVGLPLMALLSWAESDPKDKG